MMRIAIAVLASLTLTQAALAGPTTRPVAATQPTSKPDFSSIEAVLRAIPKDAYTQPTDPAGRVRKKAALNAVVGKTFAATVMFGDIWPRKAVAITSGTIERIVVTVMVDYSQLPISQLGQPLAGVKCQVAGTLTGASPQFGSHYDSRGEETQVLQGFKLKMTATSIVASQP